MSKNKNPRFRFALKKTILAILHILALAVFVTGVSLIYCNDNFKKGLIWMNSETYEDSPAFAELLGDDTDSLFDYIRYRDVFETDGKLDTEKEMFSFDVTPGTEQTYTLDDVLQYAEQRGYYLDNSYRLVADKSVQRETSSGANQTYMVNWRAYNSNKSLKEPGDAYMTLDALTAETMSCLGKYSAAKSKFNTGTSNLFYTVTYDSASFTNLDTLTADTAKSYGRYAIFTSSTVLPENNLSYTPTELTNMVQECNPDKESGGSYSAVLAVDTSYPQQDDFYYGKISYGHQRNIYFIGLILMLSGLATLLVTLVLLILMSGHTTRKSQEIVLNRVDRLGPETNALLCAVMIILCLFLAEKIGNRLLHMSIPSVYWHFAENMLAYILIYLCILVTLFSLVRGFKAGILWKNSFLRRFKNNTAKFFLDISFARRSAFYFWLTLLFNVLLTFLIVFLSLKNHTLTSRFIVAGLILFLFLFNAFQFRKKFERDEQMDDISDAIKSMAEGDTDINLDLKEYSGKEAVMAGSLNHIGQGLQTALNDAVKSERMKADLITNVSHDIKTPLTSIINYVDLIKREHPSDPKIQEYLTVLDQKSQHLKTLTEDLVEASKASTGNISIDARDIDFVELVEQTNGEFEEKYADRGLELLADLPSKSILIHADGQHLWRVLENLYSNAYKYAAGKSRVYVNMAEKDGSVFFTIKNVSEHELNISPEELTERFVRGDQSRTTEGSGLGLSIAKSLTELQGGKFELSIDGDLFKASVTFPEVQA